MAVIYDIAAIPTEYNGRLYRSRLEARWAAFFDLLNWQYEYEPFDLGVWSPDFLIKGKFQAILVEVKPIIEFDPHVADKMDRAVPYPNQENYNDTEILLLGATIEDKRDHVQIGWLRDSLAGWGDCLLLRTQDDPCSQVGFFSWHGSYHDRITGIYDGDHQVYHVDWQDILDRWCQAGNKVQYRRGA